MTAYAAVTIFAETLAEARVEGDFIKIDFFSTDKDGKMYVTGTAVLTRFIATLMIADAYNKLKKDREAPSKAKVLQFKRVERQLDDEFSLKGA